MQVLIKNNILPLEVQDLFKSLGGDEADCESKTLELEYSDFLSTHPLMQHRIEFVRNYIDNNEFTKGENRELKRIFEDVKVEI